MRDTRPLSVDVSELIRTPGASVSMRCAVELEGVEMPMARLTEGSTVAVDLQLDALVDAIHVTGSVTGVITQECARCLTETQRSVDIGVSEIIAYPADERDEAIPILDDAADLEPAIHDLLIAEVPFNPLCRPDCRGLCPTCGADRNETSCGHDDEARSDVRWSALSDLKRMLED